MSESHIKNMLLLMIYHTTTYENIKSSIRYPVVIWDGKARLPLNAMIFPILLPDKWL